MIIDSISPCFRFKPVTLLVLRTVSVKCVLVSFETKALDSSSPETQGTKSSRSTNVNVQLWILVLQI